MVEQAVKVKAEEDEGRGRSSRSYQEILEDLIKDAEESEMDNAVELLREFKELLEEELGEKV